MHTHRNLYNLLEYLGKLAKWAKLDFLDKWASLDFLGKQASLDFLGNRASLGNPASLGLGYPDKGASLDKQYSLPNQVK